MVPHFCTTVPYLLHAGSDRDLFKVTKGRISATYEKDKAKSDTFKLFGNGGTLRYKLDDRVSIMYLKVMVKRPRM